MASAVVFVPAYPISWAVDETEFLRELCIDEPVYQTFQRPLGDFGH